MRLALWPVPGTHSVNAQHHDLLAREIFIINIFSFVGSGINDGDACDLSVIKKPTSSLIDNSLI